MKKKIAALALAVITAASAISMSACSQSDNSKTYNIGICQLMQHPALDLATKGFKDVLTEKLGDKVKFNEQNAAGDASTASTICTQFVSSNVDLILANATAPLEAAAAATSTIPILGTSITDYATALGMDNWTGVTGKNISGTCDLAPLDQQADCVAAVFPSETYKDLGIIYCNNEPNSKYQADVITPLLKNLGYNVTSYTFTDSNDIASVTQSACDACDVLYIPTDNTAANCTETIKNVVIPAKIPVFAGEEGICKGCGVATLTISYEEIGRKTGEMAYEILVNGADITKMEVKSADSTTKKYNPENATALNITIPSDYTAIEAE